MKNKEYFEGCGEIVLVFIYVALILIGSKLGLEEFFGPSKIVTWVGNIVGMVFSMCFILMRNNYRDEMENEKNDELEIEKLKKENDRLNNWKSNAEKYLTSDQKYALWLEEKNNEAH